MTEAPKAQRQVGIAVDVNWQAQQVSFSEQVENGITILNPPTVSVPLPLIMKIAAEAVMLSLPPALRQMNLAPPAIEQPESTRGGRSLAFDVNVGKREH